MPCSRRHKQIRRKKHDAPAAGTARTPENTGPVARAHVDNTPLSGARRVLAEMGDEGEELAKGRCQVRFLPPSLSEVSSQKSHTTDHVIARVRLSTCGALSSILRWTARSP
mgnify:FL=1